VAKKSAREVERRARVEQMRREQARKERTRSLAILGGCVVVVVALLAAALVPYIKHQREQSKLEATPLSKLGVSSAAAACSPLVTKNAQGSGIHLPVGQKIDYPDAPPSFGKHWGNFLQGSEIRNFYTTKDRPPVERLVHSLEHGHTILWYDDTVKPGTKAYKDVQDVADHLDASAYFMSAPWTSTDGASFPSGQHVALTHWTGPSGQKGITEYCKAPSGSVVSTFMKKYPKDDAPEPGNA
jgi:hypothetical protein